MRLWSFELKLFGGECSTTTPDYSPHGLYGTGRGGRDPTSSRDGPQVTTNPCFVCMGSPVLSERLIGAARGIAVAQARDDRRGLDQGGEATRRRLKPPRLFGVSPGGQLNQDRDVRILLRSPAIILFGTFVSIRVTAAAQN